MVKELSNDGNTQDVLKSAEFPVLYVDVGMRIMRQTEKEHDVGLLSRKMKKVSLNVVDGFEDVLGGPLGEGLFSNTQGTVHQLVFALSLSDNPAVRDVISNQQQTSREAIKILRDCQALSGLKILDLGAGRSPSFALAAKALGATVYTVDLEDLSPNAQGKVDGHAKLDLNDGHAIDRLQKIAGNDFDLITENIIASRHKPKHETLVDIARQLLKPGGYFYAALRAEVLRKR